MFGGQCRPDFREVGGTVGPDFHDDAARKIDAEVKTRVKEQHDRNERQDRRHDEASDTPLHELEVGFVGREAHPGFDEHEASSDRKQFRTDRDIPARDQQSG